MAAEDRHAATTRPASYWDGLIHELRAHRARVGNPSYDAIASRVSAARQAAGSTPHAARVAKSTVFDAFRTGRGRINLDFIREIADALDAAPEEVDRWIAACQPVAPPTETLPEAPDVAVPASMKLVLGLMVACIAFNLVGRLVVDVFHLPVYLDMWGTAIAAITLGPWRGAVVGGTTNVLGALTSGSASLPFALVNVAGAVVWGLGTHRYGMGRTLPRFFALNVIVAATCSLVAVPILVLVFGGSVGQGQDTITQTFVELGNGLVAAVGLSNLMTSTADKFVSGFVALVVITVLPQALRRSAPRLLAEHRP